jgi:hypothetical protein
MGENSIIIQNFLSCFVESMVWQEKLSKWSIGLGATPFHNMVHIHQNL